MEASNSPKDLDGCSVPSRIAWNHILDSKGINRELRSCFIWSRWSRPFEHVWAIETSKVEQTILKLAALIGPSLDCGILDSRFWMGKVSHWIRKEPSRKHLEFHHNHQTSCFMAVKYSHMSPDQIPIQSYIVTCVYTYKQYWTNNTRRLYTHTNTHTYIYIWLYMYIRKYVCVQHIFVFTKPLQLRRLQPPFETMAFSHKGFSWRERQAVATGICHRHIQIKMFQKTYVQSCAYIYIYPEASNS